MDIGRPERRTTVTPTVRPVKEPARPAPTQRPTTPAKPKERRDVERT